MPPQQARRRPRHNSRALLLIAGAGAFVLGGFCLLAVLATFGLLYGSDQIMPGVHAAGVDVSGMSETDAAAALSAAWTQEGIVLRDGDRVWTAAPAELGITLDAAATAQAAQAWGRSDGGITGALSGLISGNVAIDPVLQVDLQQFSNYLQSMKTAMDLPPTNAGVRLQNGQAVAAPAVPGRTLDIPATMGRMSTDPGQELADGAINLQMLDIAPTVTDAGPLVAQANAILTSPFTVNAYDPIRDEWLSAWIAQPQEWAAWLTAEAADSSSGLMLTLNNEGPAAFLQANAQFGDERYIDVEKATATMRSVLAQGQTTATIRVWHGPTSYTVQGGQTLASIAEEVGIPYPYIQVANPDINTDALTVGQVLTLPSKDILVPLDPIPSRRIVVDRGDQHLWAYENGQVVFDWVISTGIPSSPTALGVFQIQSHDVNAYADQWDLYMPNFMGFYHPGPNMDLWNGFHGFPTRSGGYLLWTYDLGHPVTYGCILLSLENAETLYNWAQEGVVVVVRA